jgi:hypothetical protein
MEMFRIRPLANSFMLISGVTVFTGFSDPGKLADHRVAILAHVKFPVGIKEGVTDPGQCVLALVRVQASAQRPLLRDVSEERFTEGGNTGGDNRYADSDIDTATLLGFVQLVKGLEFGFVAHVQDAHWVGNGSGGSGR